MTGRPIPVAASRELKDRGLIFVGSQKEMKSKSEERASAQYVALSDKEKQCINYLASGYSVRSIAAKLSISDAEVGRTLGDLKEAFDVQCPADLVRIGLEAIASRRL